MTINRRSLISGAIGGAAGVALGRELVPSSAGAAADVDRSEFNALTARVAYLEQFHPPMPPPHVPKFSGFVTLPAGFTVPAGEVWDFDPDVSTTVEVAANVVVEGTLQMRPANPGVVHTLRFTEINEALFVGGGMTPLATDVGLWVIGAGTLDLAGAPKPSWARLATGITAGASAINLSTAPAWNVGDTITVAPTAVGQYEHFDTRTITAIADTLVSLSTPTTYPHPTATMQPGFDMNAEVLNLTSNVIVEGAPTGRAHIFITAGVPQHLTNVELRHLGPRQGNPSVGVTGRYPLHLHMMGDGSRGSTISNVVAHDCGFRAFVPHASHGVTFTGCVAYEITDEPFWWDPGTGANETHDCVWSKCVAAMVRVVPTYRGYRLAGFVLGEGDNNAVTDCTAVGVLGNTNAAGFIWPEGARKAWLFVRNIAHNNKVNGLFGWQNSGALHPVTDFACYHNGNAGISHGAYNPAYHFTNGWLIGNGATSIELHAASGWVAPTTFERLVCHGTHPVAVKLLKHTLAPAQATRFLGCTFNGHTGPTFAAYDSTNREWMDVVECTPTPTVLYNASSHPASEIRIQNGTVATLHTTTGVTTIAPFLTYVATPAAPFAVVASA